MGLRSAGLGFLFALQFPLLKALLRPYAGGIEAAFKMAWARFSHQMSKVGPYHPFMPSEISNTSSSDTLCGELVRGEKLGNVYTYKESIIPPTTLYTRECLLSRMSHILWHWIFKSSINQADSYYYPKDLIQVSRLFQKIVPGFKSRSFDLNSNVFSLCHTTLTITMLFRELFRTW